MLKLPTFLYTTQVYYPCHLKLSPICGLPCKKPKANPMCSFYRWRNTSWEELGPWSSYRTKSPFSKRCFLIHVLWMDCHLRETESSMTLLHLRSYGKSSWEQRCAFLKVTKAVTKGLSWKSPGHWDYDTLLFPGIWEWCPRKGKALLWVHSSECGAGITDFLSAKHPAFPVTWRASPIFYFCLPSQFC